MERQDPTNQAGGGGPERVTDSSDYRDRSAPAERSVPRFSSATVEVGPATVVGPSAERRSPDLEATEGAGTGSSTKQKARRRRAARSQVPGNGSRAPPKRSRAA